jgi:hypothetical protein
MDHRSRAEFFADRSRAKGTRPGYVLTGIVKRSVVLTLSFHDGVAPEKEIVSDRVRIYGHG